MSSTERLEQEAKFRLQAGTWVFEVSGPPSKKSRRRSNGKWQNRFPVIALGVLVLVVLLAWYFDRSAFLALVTILRLMKDILGK